MSLQPPYITQATFCERVLSEKDGVLSAIRIIDTLNINVLPGTDVDGLVQKLDLLITIKSGDFNGEGTLKIRAIAPNGEPMKNGESITRMVLNGGVHGANVHISVGITVNVKGTYWYEISFNDRVLTRTPLSVSVTESQTLLPMTRTSLQKKAKAN